ncbi:MAG: peptide chain release factor 2 [Alphaproteobacteria bacterium]|nr:peptide chain release factor 2 [Alphaproteobacteria bacterium]
MKAEIIALHDRYVRVIRMLKECLDWGDALLRQEELDALTADPDLWTDAEKAARLMGERNTLAARIGAVRELERQERDGYALIELAEAEADDALLRDAEEGYQKLAPTFDAAELESLLNHEADANDAFLEIHAGAGGTESQDWADMLRRMYTRWAEQNGYVIRTIEQSDGEEAGIKSATLKIGGRNAYGWLKNESGVHRLVRISPFDANARRHTSFASVWVWPAVDDSIQIDIDPADCRVDVYRASGAGGQHVNKTESAVRITHLPTGIAVSSQMHRSQHQNRAEAWAMLRARLYEAELQKRDAAQTAAESAKGDNGWGNQIRSYVLQPYQMVKDLRTGFETSDARGVLDGDLNGLMRAALTRKTEENHA